MTPFSSSTANAALITFIILVQVASFIVCALGLLCYRGLMSSRRQFLSSLRTESDALARTHAHSLVRTYVVLTFLLTVTSTTLFFWFYRLP